MLEWDEVLNRYKTKEVWMLAWINWFVYDKWCHITSYKIGRRYINL